MNSIRLDMTFPISEFRKDIKSHVDRIAETDCPEVLTVQGKPKVVMMSALMYQELMDQLDFLKHQAGIERGLEDLNAGRVSQMRSGIHEVVNELNLDLDQ